MAKDPIIDEIHRVRERIWEECHGRAEEMARRQRAIERKYADRLIDPDKWKRRHKKRAATGK